MTHILVRGFLVLNEKVVRHDNGSTPGFKPGV